MVLPFAGKRDGGSHYTMESKPLERSNKKIACFFLPLIFFAHEKYSCESSDTCISYFLASDFDHDFTQISQWYLVAKIVPTYCEKKLF